MINFIVCGLENTLLRDEKIEICEETIELISELNQNGIKIAVATGRNYDAVKQLFGKVKNDIIYICNDGGVIIYQDKVISKTPVDRLVCLEVMSEIEKDDEFIRRFKLIFADERRVMVNTHDIDFINYLRNMGMEPEYVRDTKELHNDITKITICARNGFDGVTYEHFYTKWAKKANVAISTPEQMYITGQYVTKGMAIALLQHVFQISEEDTVVFGSGYSDIDMFEHCFYSYAMQWSDAEVKRSAKHIAENVDTILEDIMRM
jgi:hypothetical protein